MNKKIRDNRRGKIKKAKTSLWHLQLKALGAFMK